MKKVGFIGLGIMGGPMASNLAKAGVDLMVYDLNDNVKKKVMDLGARGANSKEEIGKACDIIFLILPTEAIVRDVLFGDDGVASYMKKGAIICDESSVTPGEARYCYDKLKEMGISFMDAPVSGGEPGAINGTLAIMAGGDPETFDILKPYFDIMGSSALFMGGSGTGSITKLANQMIVNLNIAIVSEAFVFATKAGVDPEKVFYAIKGGLAGSTVMNDKIPMILDRNFKPGGRIFINHKDIKNALATAHEVDVPVPLTSQLFEIMQALKVAGHMEDDHSGIVQYFEALADTKVERGHTKSEK